MNHAHFEVNGRKVNIPSYQLRPGDVVSVREKSRKAGAIVEALETTAGRRVPEWLSLDAEAMSGRVLAVPTREQIDTQVNEALIVEFYSR